MLAQIQDPRLNFWNDPNGSPTLWWKIGIGLIVGIALVALLTRTPPQFRKYAIGISTFLAGAVYVAFWLWPKPKA